jgi:murein DD-endopeptidase MepM/ murein hydrolase activator NlpD
MSKIKILITLILLAGMLFACQSGTSSQEPAPTPTGPKPTATPLDGLSLESTAAEISVAVITEVQSAAEKTPAYFLFSPDIQTIQITEDESWALAYLLLTDPQTGEVLPSEPGLVLARRVDDEWQITLPSDDGWLQRLQEAPSELLSDEHKAAWIERYEEALALIPTEAISGYLLPWAGGITRYLSRSVTHDIDIPSGNAHYAFDFYTSGQMWDLYASKSGTVWIWRDDVPTCTQYTCSQTQPVGNYIVLRDPTTNPVTYQLYLHLAQNSIPPALKAQGAPVLQGQFIGVADNTGQSWGHHLHFQVHTNPASYWGASVDITFDDVSINGGRPRTPYEAQYYPQYGTQGQLTYLSQNFVQGDPYPPTGDMFNPFTNGFSVNNGSLYLEGWATDVGSGVASARFLANHDGTWREISPSFNTTIFSYTWDLCASGVPVGPVSVALRIVDYANNHAPGLPGLRHGINNSACPPPPPTCAPNANQVALYAEPDYAGVCILLGAGDYADHVSLGALGNDNAESIRVGANLRATLFSEPGYAGRSETFLVDDSNLSDNRIGSNTLSSLRIESRTTMPSTPTPLWPPSNSSLPGNNSLTMHWRDNGGGSQFDVQILSGGTTVASGTVAETAWHAGSLLPGAYTWRARARAGAATSNWSSEVPFSIQAPPTYSTEIIAPPYLDDMESSPERWSVSPGWQRLNDASQARSPSHAFVFTAQTDSQPASGSLTSARIQIPAGNYGLYFHYRYHSEGNGPHWDQRWVQISQDDGPFVNVLQLTDDPLGTWLRSPTIDLTPYAGSIIRVRFYFHSLDGLNNSGLIWNIDDLHIEEIAPLTCNDPHEPNNSPATATTLALNGSRSGTICGHGDIDYYKITISQAGTRIAVHVAAHAAGSALDPYLFLLDSDGVSILAENDDEIPGVSVDSRLGYIFQRTGTYYLKLKAWDHPSAGSPDHYYTISIQTDTTRPSVSMVSPVSNGYVRVDENLVTVQASDTGSGISRVRVWWHDNEWQYGQWQLLGEDWDGADGWSVPFNTAPLTERTGIAFYAQAIDHAGNSSSAAAWDVTLDKTPPVSSMQSLTPQQGSTAVLLQWTASDNMAGLERFDLQSQLPGSPWVQLESAPGTARQAWVIGEMGQTLAFRMRGVDRAGNTEAYPGSPEAQTQIQTCTQPDPWDATAPGDDDPANAAPLQVGGLPETRNFCQLNDQDWVKFELEAGERMAIRAIPEHLSTAVRLTLYRWENSQLSLVAVGEPTHFGAVTILRIQPTASGLYYLQAAHVDGRVAGNDVAYHLYVGPDRTAFFPIIRK